MSSVIIDLPISCIDDDLFDCSDNYKNTSLTTLNNYIDKLNQSLSMLNIIKESLTNDEFNSININSEDNSMMINGTPEILDRFIAFGIAHIDLDNEIEQSGTHYADDEEGSNEDTESDDWTDENSCESDLFE